MQDSTFADIDFSDFPTSIFKVNHVFIEKKDNPVEKVVIDEKVVDGTEIDSILNLENLPKTVLIDCWNLKVVVDGEERTRNINKK